MHRRETGRPPPPPLLGGGRSSRGSGGGSNRPGARSRSRSRSRSPPARGGGGSRNERDSRDLRERSERDRGEKERERRRSISPYGAGGGGSSSRDKFRGERDRKPTSSTSAGGAGKASDTAVPAVVSIIHSETHSAIIRRILNPEDVKIPRRVNEGSKPIFERDELREAMVRRMRNNDNEENPPQANAYIQEPTVTQQRVVAIIREPVGSSLDAYLATKDPAFHHAVSAGSRVSPDRRRSPSPRSIRQNSSSKGSRRSPDLRSPLIPQLSTSLNRSVEQREREQRERERLILERERALERERQQFLREREQLITQDRLPEFRDRDRNLHRPAEDRNERERGSRFSGAGTSQTPPTRIEIRQRVRSRSPVTRVLRDDSRLSRRRSRSHSVTPPPMPDEFRQRLILERQKQVDLRNSLSRQPGKFGHDDRTSRGRPGPGPSRGGGRGGRGGFASRSVRGREDERRAWVHDMFDGGDEPKKG